VANKNITFSLPVALLREAKVFAAQHNTTMNAMVRELLEEKLRSNRRASAAVEQMLAIAAEAPLFSVDLQSFSRDELHER
jgi:plasmid stability protein